MRLTQKLASCIRVLSLTALLSCVVHAETYYSVEGSESGKYTVAWAWKTADGASASVTPAKEDGHTWVLLAAKKLTSTATLPGTTWYLGSDGNVLSKKGAYSQSFNGGISFSVPKATVYGCSLVVNSAGTLTLKGDYSFVNVGQIFKLYTNATSDERHLTFDETFKATGDSDVSLRFPLVRAWAGTTRVKVSGDFSGFKGNFVVSQTKLEVAGSLSELQLISASAFGDPTAERDDAVVIKANTKLVIGPAVEQSATRGVTFDLTDDQTAYIGTMGEVTSETTVTAPFKGAMGTLVKTDLGKLTLANVLETKNLIVREGTLVLDQTAQVPADLVVTVEKGATFVYSADRAGKITILGDGTQTLLPIELGETPVTLAAGYDPGDAQLTLTHAFPLPLNEGARLEALRIPNGTLSLDKIVDVTERVGGLPMTHFESETVDGVQTIYLVARPAIARTAQKISDPATDTNWSDGKAIHADADYYHMSGDYGCYAGEFRMGTGSNGKDFSLAAAETLTLRGRYIGNYMRKLNVGNLRAYAGGILRMIYATSNNGADMMYRRVTGDIAIDAEATVSGSPFSICMGTWTHNADVGATNNVVEATIHGAGEMRIYCENSASTIEKPSLVRLTGDNTGLTGRVVIETYSSSGNRYPVVVSIPAASALGGEMDVAAENGIRLVSKSDADKIGSAVLQIEQSTAFTAEKRGIRIDNSTLRVLEGVTCAIRSPLRVVGTLVKDGSGTLALGAPVPIESNATAIKVREGFMMPLTSDAFTRFNLTFSDGAGIAIDADVEDADVREKGLAPRSFAFENETDKLRVEVRNWQDRPGEPLVRRAILTVSTSVDDLSKRIEFVGKGRKVLSSELNADESKRTYFVTCSKQGMMIVFR